MGDLSPVLDKVRKLLRLAQSDNANEAAAAMAAAQRLIDEHRLSVAELEASGEKPAEPMDTTGQSLMDGPRVPSWKHRLFIVLGRANGCATWVHRTVVPENGQMKKTAQYRAVGRASDLEAFKYVLSYAVVELERIAGKQCAGLGRVYRSNWYLGAVVGIKIQIDEAQAQFHEQAAERGSTAALVLLDKRRDASIELRDKLFGQMRTIHIGEPRQPDLDAFHRGKQVGYNMNLGDRHTLAK